MSDGQIAFRPGTELITRDWLEKYADEIIPGKGPFGVAVFVVESDEGDFNPGWNRVVVELPQCNGDRVAVEVQNKVGDDEPTAALFGLFDRLDDLRAILEIMARGNV